MKIKNIAFVIIHSEAGGTRFSVVRHLKLMFPPSVSVLHQAADESSEEAAFYEILPCCARFRCGELIAEGQWHHLVLVMSKGMLKNSMATLYLDGQLVNTVKVKRRTPYVL